MEPAWSVILEVSPTQDSIAFPIFAHSERVARCVGGRHFECRKEFTFALLYFATLSNFVVCAIIFLLVAVIIFRESIEV